jgi:hypothetical protein
MNKGSSRSDAVHPSVTIAATCFDVSIGVRCRPVEAAAVSAHMPLGCRLINAAKADHMFVLEADAENDNLFSIKRRFSATAPEPQPLDSALMALQKELHLCIAEHATDYVFVHAGVVAWKDRILVFPGSSHAGKSTLIWHLVQAGALYYSDEYAVFDELGRVHPFALPIGLRLNAGKRRMVTPNNIGAFQRKPDFLIFAKYRLGAIWRPRLLTPAAAVLELVRHSIAIRRNPRFVIPVLKKISVQSTPFSGIRGESQQLLDWIQSLE